MQKEGWTEEQALRGAYVDLIEISVQGFTSYGVCDIVLGSDIF